MDVLILLITVLIAAGPAARESDLVPEAVAKAAVLYNLATYTSWPDARSGRPELVIGVMGPDPVFTALRELDGKRVQGRTITTRLVQSDAEARECDILYVPATQSRAYALLRALDGAAVLTVSDGDAAVREATAVRIGFQRARIRLEIELTALERAGLRLSSKVLSLSRVLRNGQMVTNATRP